MHDHAPRPTGSDLEALNDSELRALLARVQSELGGRAMSDEEILEQMRSSAKLDPFQDGVLSDPAEVTDGFDEHGNVRYFED